MGNVFALSDLHLSLALPKPMDVFGEIWRGHEDKIGENWLRTVQAKDLVLVPGDISWALKPQYARVDLEFVDRLPGKKVISRGNHDYWWPKSSAKMKELLSGLGFITAINNSAARIEDHEVVIAAVRGWPEPGSEELMLPGLEQSKPVDNERIYRREVDRLRRTLEEAGSLSKGEVPILAMIHFPPFSEGKATEFGQLILDKAVTACVYGHLHREEDWRQAFQGTMRASRFFLAAADYLDFKPILIDLGRLAE